MPDWDAARYHRLSDPQHAWGLRVLERLQPAPGERILDIGCGTGRLTAEIRQRQPGAQVVAIDPSWSMVTEATRQFAGMMHVVQADGAALPLASCVDAVFSTAAFHWIHDHPRLFGEIHRVLVPGGRLISQAGGGPNLLRLYDRTRALAAEPEFEAFFVGWKDPSYYAGVEETEARLAAAGFTHMDVWLESTPTPFADASAYEAFVTTVCLRHHLARVPDTLRRPYLDRLVLLAGDADPRYTLDYWRLNIDARKP